jgi:hypothetical protein
MAGISSDHTDAATMTPDANPSSDFCNRTDISFFMRKTKDAPNIVPNNGMSSPMINAISANIFLIPLQRYKKKMTMQRFPKIG